MVYAEEYASIEGAIAREYQLKRWSREKKEALIRADQTALESLSHRSSKATVAFPWRDFLKWKAEH